MVFCQRNACFTGVGDEPEFQLIPTMTEPSRLMLLPYMSKSSSVSPARCPKAVVVPAFPVAVVATQRNAFTLYGVDWLSEELVPAITVPSELTELRLWFK